MYAGAMSNRPRNKVAAVIGAAFGVASLAIALFLVACPLVNDRTAARVADDIAAIPVPDDTRIVERFSGAGKLTGNGNGMQFLGAVLIQSGLTRDELDDHYAAYRQGEWDLLVDEQTARDIDIVEHGDYAFATDVSDTSDGRWYIVYTWGDGVAPFSWFDLRGN